jgi:tight adherence protein C
MLYALFAFLIFFALVASAMLLVFYRETLGRRLGLITGVNRDEPDRPTKAAQLNERVRTVAETLQKALPKGEKETSVAQQRLTLAGYREASHLHVLNASKVLLPVVLVGLAWITGAYHLQPVTVLIAALAVGYLAPEYWLGHLIKKRQLEIGLGLPDALDFMVVCLEAGLSLDQAVIRTSEELASGHAALAEEFGLVMLEVRAGRNRIDAWKSLMTRTDIDEIRMLVAVFVQADTFGTSVSKNLRVHADGMRTRRAQRVEELAAKTPVKLIFPLVLFIFPSLYVVILGPAVIQIIATFKDKPIT